MVDDLMAMPLSDDSASRSCRWLIFGNQGLAITTGVGLSRIPESPARKSMSADGPNHSKASDSDCVPSGDEERGIVSALRRIEGGRDAARQHPCHRTSERRFRRRGMAQREQEHGERTNAY